MILVEAVRNSEKRAVPVFEGAPRRSIEKKNNDMYPMDVAKFGGSYVY